MAHIVAQKPDGPRGRNTPPGGEIDGYENLILLCHRHHELVDDQEQAYPVEKLVQMRLDHERWVNEQLSPRERFTGVVTDGDYVDEHVHSTLLPVVRYPQYIYSASCDLTTSRVRDQIHEPTPRHIMLPFILRNERLFTFYDLRDDDNPFRDAIDAGDIERSHADEWWMDPDLNRWYVDLLNRSLNKLTGRKGLRLDKEHKRYYFEPLPSGKSRKVGYLTMTGRRSHRSVAYRPTVRSTGESKNYWEHWAVGLRFHKVSSEGWCLSIRPERRFTRDGFEPITPKGTGRRSASRKSRMYNIDVLEEVHFWRDFLSGGRPRISFDFGTQRLLVDTTLLNCHITWPGVPDDAAPFTQQSYEEDLFTLADFDGWDDEATDDGLEFDVEEAE